MKHHNKLVSKTEGVFVVDPKHTWMDFATLYQEMVAAELAKLKNGPVKVVYSREKGEAKSE